MVQEISRKVILFRWDIRREFQFAVNIKSELDENRPAGYIEIALAHLALKKDGVPKDIFESNEQLPQNRLLGLAGENCNSLGAPG